MIDHFSELLPDREIRVAHILRKYDPREWGGTETAIRDLVKGLEAQSVESVIYAPKLLHSTQIEDSFGALGAHLNRFRAFIPMIGLEEMDRKALIAIGGNIVSFDIFRQLHRNSGLDVIHTHALGRLGSIARVIARQKRIPFVITIHGGYLDLPATVVDKLIAPGQLGFDYGKLFGLLLRSRHLVEKADAVITVNPREAELLRAKWPALRVEVIPHGLPTAIYDRDHRIAAQTHFPTIRERTIVLSVGRLDAVKNQAFLIESLPRLHRERPNALLVLVGPTTDSAYERNIRERIRDLKLENSVLLTGLLPPNDPRLIGLYQSAHVLVLPSKSETFGLVLLEAWAAGCPVIASSTSGAKQLIRSDENGFLFPVNDPQGLVQAFRHTFQSEDRRKSLGQMGQKMVRTHYDTRVVAKRIRHLYADLLMKARGKARVRSSSPKGQP
jgi:alpha-maltose-1-phosphate synthase